MMSVGRGLEVGRGRRNDEGVCYNSLQTGGGRTKSKRRGIGNVRKLTLITPTNSNEKEKDKKLALEKLLLEKNCVIDELTRTAKNVH